MNDDRFRKYAPRARMMREGKLRAVEAFGSEQFRKALNHVGIQLSTFVFIFGVSERRAQRWYGGTEDISPWVPIALALLTLPGGVAMAHTAAKLLRQPATEGDDR